MTVATVNPFVKSEENHVGVAGFMFNSFWGDVTHLAPETVDTPSGVKASGVIAFRDGQNDRLEYFYVEPTETATIRYRVTISGGASQKEIIGYSLPNLLDLLKDNKQVRELSGEDGFNYAGMTFIYDKDESRVGKYFSYCLSTPADKLAGLRLEVIVKKLYN